MSSENIVRAVQMSFGTAGTSTLQANAGTSTSNPINLPRNDFTGAVTVLGTLVTTTASTTATNNAVATCVWQASNDKVAWFGISSASATAGSTATTTGVVSTFTTAVTAGVNFVSQRYGYLRAIVTVTGTGNASVPMGL